MKLEEGCNCRIVNDRWAETIYSTRNYNNRFHAGDKGIIKQDGLIHIIKIKPGRIIGIYYYHPFLDAAGTLLPNGTIVELEITDIDGTENIYEDNAGIINYIWWKLCYLKAIILHIYCKI